MDETVTKTPMTAPTEMVAIFKLDPLGKKSGLSCTHFKILALNKSDPAVRRTEMPIDMLIRWLKFFETGPTYLSARIDRIAVVRLPMQSSLTMSHRTFPCNLCAAVPNPLVIAANARSVPTAVVGPTPKMIVNKGVIKEPPPTPVIPTRRPTSAPETMNWEESRKNWIILEATPAYAKDCSNSSSLMAFMRNRIWRWKLLRSSTLSCGRRSCSRNKLVITGL